MESDSQQELQTALIEGLSTWCKNDNQFFFRFLHFCYFRPCISGFLIPVVPLLFPWLSRSVLVVAMVSASAMRDICSIRVNPGKLEWRR